MRYRSFFSSFSLLLAVIFLSNCTVIRQGEVGVKRRLGRISPTPYTEGTVGFNPFVTTVIRVPVRTSNLEVSLNLPSKEGLTIGSEISILYRIKANSAPKILQEIGIDYERSLILPVFRSAAPDVTAKFLAKDMHSGERGLIEKAIRDQMAQILEPKGFDIENVLLKSIQLPAGLSRAIEEKLQAEQDAQRMEFLKQREKVEAERKVIQAEGEKSVQIVTAEGQKRVTEIGAEGRANAIRTEADAQAKANEVLMKSITPNLLRYRSIDAFKSLSDSKNSKLVISDGKNPFLGLPGSIIE